MNHREFLMRFGITLIGTILIGAVFKVEYTAVTPLIYVGGSIFWAALLTKK